MKKTTLLDEKRVDDSLEVLKTEGPSLDWVNFERLISVSVSRLSFFTKAFSSDFYGEFSKLIQATEIFLQKCSEAPVDQPVPTRSSKSWTALDLDLQHSLEKSNPPIFRKTHKNPNALRWMKRMGEFWLQTDPKKDGFAAFSNMNEVYEALSGCPLTRDYLGAVTSTFIPRTKSVPIGTPQLSTDRVIARPSRRPSRAKLKTYQDFRQKKI